MNTYDAIVIGSGIGGLTTASLLAQIKGWRVLVLERHFTFGGFTHEFSRSKHGRWDVGLHYVGNMSEGEQPQKLFNYITRSGVQWQPMASPFEKFVYPDMTVEVPTNPEDYQATLIRHFPHEKEAIERYFRDIRHVAAWNMRYFLQRFGFPLDWLAHPALKLINTLTDPYARGTTAQYLSDHIRDERLRGMLVSQWGDYGLPPSKSAFAIHALIVEHYLNGASYPVGGAGTIAAAVERIIKQHGGGCLTKHQVTNILIDHNKAVGVEVEVHMGSQSYKETFYAPVVISDAGARTTFLNLLPEKYSEGFRETLQTLPAGYEVATVYLGFKESPSKLGFKGENHWIYASYDHDKNHLRRNDVLDSEPSSCYLSFPSLKDPAATAYTGEIITPLDFAQVQEWSATEWKRRGKDYNDLKHHIAQNLIGFVDKHYPGFADLVDFYEVSTPLTVQQFTGHTHGGIYGIPATPERFGYEWLRPETSLEGLYLTGTDVASLGIVGAMQGGVATASTILNGGMVAIMTAVEKYAAAKSLH